MVFIAGLREVGSTPDTETYEEMYNGTYSEVLESVTEPSFTFITYVLNSLSLGVNSLFFVYALISISIHLSALWKMSKVPFMTLTIYVSFYYMMHDLVQIRCAVASGLFLWAIYFYSERKKLLTLVCIIVGTLFHYSALTGLAIFFFDYKLRDWEKYLMYVLIPIGLVAYFGKLDISALIPESVGGEKLALYRELKERGLDEEQGGYPLKYNIVIWLNFLLFYFVLFYEKFLSEKSKYIIIAIKVQALAFCCLFFLNGVTMILSSRLNSYFSIASIILWTYIIYAFQPLIVGKIINTCISALRFVTSMLFYALSLYFL